MSYTLEFPFQYIANPDSFGVVAIGEMYIGVVDGDPAFEPGDRIQVYASRQNDADLPISQPIDIGPGGIPVYLGSPVSLKINQEYSLSILDRNGQQVFYAPRVGEIITTLADIIQRLIVVESDSVIINTWADIENTPVVRAGQLFTLAQNTSGGIGGGPMMAFAGSVVDDGFTQKNSATPGFYLKMIDYSIYLPLTRPSIKTNSIYGDLIIGSNPLPNADWPNPVALKDAATVSRSLSGEQSNYHGFADKTIMDNMSNGGGYGVFDATVRLKGSVVQDHIYSFQDRNYYMGSASIANMAGLYSAPTHSGSGTVVSRKGAHVLDITKTGGGAVTNNVAYQADDMVGGDVNVSFLSNQTTDFSYYAGNGGRMYQKGKAGFGVDPSSFAYAISIMGSTSGSPLGLLDTAPSFGAAFGVFGDNGVSLVANGDIRLAIQTSSSSYAVTPGADNTQPLGNGARRWSVVYSGTATINTSDGRLKQQIKPIDDACLRAWSKVNFCQYKLNESVSEKGENARWHFGVIAQQVKEAFESEGLNSFDYGILCYDEWGDEFINEHVNKDRPDEEPIFIEKQIQWSGSRYGIRYEEALILECALLREKMKSL